MKSVVRTLLALFFFVAVALAFDTDYKTRLITSATLTIHVKDGQFVTIRNFTQDHDVGQRGVLVAGIVPPTPTPTAAPTPTPTPTPPFISTQPGPAVALSTGDKLTDSATLFGFNNPTGTISFSLQDPTNLVVYTDQVTVSGNNTYSTATGTNPGGYAPTVTGTFTWAASYSGDSNNPAAIETGETEIVTATPTPTPAASPTPTPISAIVLTASLSTTSTVTVEDFVQPFVIAGPADLTIEPVQGATLAITYRKSLQPIQPTPTPTSSVTAATSSTSSSFSTSTSAHTSTTSRSTTVTLSNDDEIEWSTPTPTPSPTPTASSRLRAAITPTPTATPSVTPTATPQK
jgi:hypothetical protein